MTIYPIDILGYIEEVYSPDFPDDRRPVIAVVGGGASGTLTAVHLLRLAARRGGLRIALIDRLGRHGLGQAYSTTHPGHLLNSPAAKMSAVAGDPGHLLRWARAAVDADGGAGTGGAGGVAQDGFLSRQVYGRYLCDLLATAERTAHPAATVRHVTSDVVRISDGAPRHPLRLHLAADGHIDADAAVLATGNLPPRPPCPVPATQRYIADPWAPGALRGACDGSPVVVLGTGLTAMDVAIAVTGAGRRTVVHAVSRHALLPQPHRQGAATAGIGWLPVLSDDLGPVRLTELMWQVRTAVADRPGYWQDIVDSLRPYVPRLWRRLPVADQRLFLRHVARYWEVHRHRMPPDTARRVTALRCARRLTVHAGRVTQITEACDGLRARVRPRPGPARSAQAGPRRQPGRRRARRVRSAEPHDLHPGPAAARAPLRDHGHPRDPRPGRRARPAPHRDDQHPRPPHQRRLGAPPPNGPHAEYNPA
jgi:uncharacterized NAD(P)/FAD-binding protein YdhS